MCHRGSGDGDGLAIVNSAGRDQFYLEIRGVSFPGSRDGVLFRPGGDECEDAFNSCQLSFLTHNGSPDATAACRLNAVLNSRHFGVHNAVGGTALELRQFQFGGITGSTSSRRGCSLAFHGYSLANVVEWLDVEACEDGVLIAGDDSNINRFGMLYGANVGGRSGDTRRPSRRESTPRSSATPSTPSRRRPPGSTPSDCATARSTDRRPQPVAGRRHPSPSPVVWQGEVAVSWRRGRLCRLSAEKSMPPVGGEVDAAWRGRRRRPLPSPVTGTRR